MQTGNFSLTKIPVENSVSRKNHRSRMELLEIMDFWSNYTGRPGGNRVWNTLLTDIFRWSMVAKRNFPRDFVITMNFAKFYRAKDNESCPARRINPSGTSRFIVECILRSLHPVLLNSLSSFLLRVSRWKVPRSFRYQSLIEFLNL